MPLRVRAPLLALPSTITRVRTSTRGSFGAAGGSGAAVTSFTGLPAIGNKIIVAVPSQVNAGTSTYTLAVTDNQGHTYTKVTDAGGQAAGQLFHATLWETTVTASSGTFTITATVTTNSAINTAHYVQATEWSGLGLFDKQATASVASGAMTATTATLANPNSLVVVISCVNTTTTSPSTPGYTNISSDTAGTLQGYSFDYKIVSSTAAVAATQTSGADGFIAVAVWSQYVIPPTKYSLYRPTQDTGALTNIKSITIANVAAGDNYVIFQANANIDLKEVKCVTQGGGNVSFTIYTGADRTGATGNTNLISMTLSNTTTGNSMAIWPGDSNYATINLLRSPGSNWTFSNGNYTVTQASATTDNHVYVSQPVTRGRYYAELRKDVSGTADGTGIGLVLGYQRANGFISNSQMGFICWETGGISARYANNLIYQIPGSPATSIWTTALGDRIQMAVDMDRQLVWERLNGGIWNNSASADPVTGVGGADFSFLGPVGTPMYLAWNANLPSTARRTLLVTPSSWTNTVPAGYKAFPNVMAGANAYQATVTLNPNDCDTTITISNNFVTARGSADFKSVRAGPSFASPSKVYFEVIIGAKSVSTGSDAVGVGTASMSLTGWDVNAILASCDNNIYKNSVSQALTGTVATAGSIISIAFDAGAAKLWARVNGGNWNNAAIGSQNPASNTGGVASGLTGPFYAILDPHTNGVQHAIWNAKDWKYPAPAGFSDIVPLTVTAPVITANSYVWVSVANTQGTVNELHITMRF